ncbi:MAG: hypothetical protein JW955_01135 [Sedimentisphaerales bacterium]|nr:hypothetical protein [Sedimentisphaerales bacterium]
MEHRNRGTGRRRPTHHSNAPSFLNPDGVPWPLLAAALYVAFAVYLYYPYFGGFTRRQWFLPINACAAAFGCFLLSRRWVAAFAGSLLAGAVYGFTPFTLGLAKYHPAAGFLAASVPWLFLPAAFLRKTRGKWLGTSLLFLPFVVILLFFYLFADVFVRHRLFAAPLGAAVHLSDLAGFLAPLVLAKRGITLMGIYHAPVAAFVLGVAMIWKARRYNILVVLAIGLLLAFSKSFIDRRHMALLGVSPVLWLSIPLVWCAVLSGIGLQGLLEAGFTDRKWLLTAVGIVSALSIANLFLATKYFQVIFGLADRYAQLFVLTGKMYLLGAVATGIIFVMVRQRLRVHWLRWAVLVAALTVDIVLGARYVIDRVL